jgi:hypothetical protein
MKWYCLSNSGMATLCHDEQDAILTAKDADMEWPHHGPHRAVQLVPYKPVPDALTRADCEGPEYTSGWNDCRAEMLKGMK